MCGIAGAVNWGDQSTLLRMTELQSHRGPDDSGIWEHVQSDGTWVGLGNRRLAILDLSSAGHMPMSNEDGTVWITYNGEIYNFLELRQNLLCHGHKFRSSSDTEVILHMYEENGPECVKYLNGMFGLAIWDSRLQHLFLARDHFGIKPLYYIQKGNRLAFASEIKSLLILPDCPRRMSVESLHQYLTFLWVPDPQTMFEGILKLLPGHYAVFKGGKLDIVQYWDLAYPAAEQRNHLPEAELAAEVRERFFQVVKSQMVSDVPLGAFLSAGMDSSSIVGAMAHAHPNPVRTYTISFPRRYRVGETTLDDPAVAARTAAHFGCKHTEILVDPQVVELLPKLVWHTDEPVADPAIITAFLVNREARKTVTVLLSGIGGDELFAGYRKHVAHYVAQHYQRLPAFLRRDLLEPVILSLPVFRHTFLKGSVRLAKKMARSGSLAGEDRFLMDSTYLTEEQKARLYSASFGRQLNGLDPMKTHRAHFLRVRHADFLHQMLYVDIKTFMVSLNLSYNDKMSMASSVEVRVPFLDWKFAEWVAQNVPPDLKLRGTTTKYLFRRAMKSSLPAEVLHQKKAGFGAPLDYWLANDLREMVDDLLGTERLKRRDLFEPDLVHRMISEQRGGSGDWSMQIWQLLTLELWLQAFID